MVMALHKFCCCCCCCYYSKNTKNPYEQVAFRTATTIAKTNPQRTDNILQEEVFTKTYS